MTPAPTTCFIAQISTMLIVGCGGDRLRFSPLTPPPPGSAAEAEAEALEARLQAAPAEQKLAALSDLTSAQRTSEQFAPNALALEAFADAQPAHPAAQVARLWAGDSWMLANEAERAETAYQRVVDGAGPALLAERSLSGIAAHKLAALAAARGDHAAAAIELARVSGAAATGFDASEVAYALGSAHLRAGDLSRGLDALSQSQATAPTNGVRADAAHLATLATSGIGQMDRERLVQQVKDAVAAGDADALQKLMPADSISLAAAGAERTAVDGKVAAGFVREVISLPRAFVSEHVSGPTRAKTYLQFSDGASEVSVVVVDTPVGYVVEGLVLSPQYAALILPALAADSVAPTVAPAVTPAVTPDKVPAATPMPRSVSAVGFKMPWRAGVGFRAGGLSPHFPYAQLGNPFDSVCGGGAPGFYFGLQTHTGADFYAIDWVRNNQFDPTPAAGGQPVLAAQDGVVKVAVDWNPTGCSDPNCPNKVYIRHFPDPSVIDYDAIQKGTFDWSLADYETHYLHLKGPGPMHVRVSEGQFVRQGALLGFVNDTGNSAYDHLHFSIRSRDNGWNSVNPSGLDGVNFQDSYADDGKCVTSSNVQR